MAEVVTYSIFSSAWFWLLLVAILFIVIGVILLALVGTAWGVGIILLGVLFLIVAGLVGFFAGSQNTTVALLNAPPAVPPAVTQQTTEFVPVEKEITTMRPFKENVEVTTMKPVKERIIQNVPITKTTTIRQGVPINRPVVVQQATPVNRAVVVQQGLPSGTVYPVQQVPFGQVGQQAQLAQGLQGLQPRGGDQGLNNLIQAASVPGNRPGMINGFGQ